MARLMFYSKGSKMSVHEILSSITAVMQFQNAIKVSETVKPDYSYLTPHMRPH